MVFKQGMGEAIAVQCNWSFSRGLRRLELGWMFALAGMIGMGLPATYGAEVPLPVPPEAIAPIQSGLQPSSWAVPVVLEKPSSATPQSPIKTKEQIPAATTVALKDGVYLYGQTNKPDQLGQTYLVFEARQGQVTGAFYMPYSSFDCFYGQLQADRLAMTVIDSYDQTPQAYAIALDSTHTADRQDPQSQFALQGFQPLAKVSANDHRILKVCQTAAR